jgi:glycerol-3-phosphate dehydrogenase
MYLLVYENNKFTLYCPDIFGIGSWGSSSQVSLEKKRKYWYVVHWTAGNEYIDDIEESYRLNVVLEAAELEQIINYVMKNCPAAVESVLVQAQEIYHERVAFENWAATRERS